MSTHIYAPIEALTDPELKDAERRVLFALFSFRNRTTDLVRPSLPKLAARALIADHSRVSKITTSLARKGWLTKRKAGFSGYNNYVLTIPDRLLTPDDLEADKQAVREGTAPYVESANLAESAQLDKNTQPNLAENTQPNLAKNAQCREHSLEHGVEQKSTRKPRTGPPSKKISMRQFLTDCNARSVRPIAEDDPVFRYAAEAQIPKEYLRLAWLEFVERHLDKKGHKGYVDWPAAFLNSVRGNWYGLWYAPPDGGEYQLTTKGVQASRKHSNRSVHTE